MDSGDVAYHTTSLCCRGCAWVAEARVTYDPTSLYFLVTYIILYGRGMGMILAWRVLKHFPARLCRAVNYLKRVLAKSICHASDAGFYSAYAR